MNSDYVRTVRLLLDVAPTIFVAPCFALKGGTALNLFVQDMPRLSVDIDLVFLPHDLPRIDALTAIGQQLQAAKRRIEAIGYQAHLRKNRDGSEVKLFVRDGGCEIKIEVNAVFRGTVLPPKWRALVPAAQALFTTELRVPVLAVEELYASKLVAALDRQHPRDLFDVQLMFKTRSWDEPLLDCFVVYLAGHNRPVHEVLFPRVKPLDAVFRGEFEGMTAIPVQLSQLEATRRQILDTLPRALLPRQRAFAFLAAVRARLGANAHRPPRAPAGASVEIGASASARLPTRQIPSATRRVGRTL